MPVTDPYKSKRHKFYADEEIVAGIDALAILNKQQGKRGVTRSEILANAAAKLLRSQSARLRKAGHKLPESLFSK